MSGAEDLIGGPDGALGSIRRPALSKGRFSAATTVILGDVSLVLAAILGALATQIIGPLMVALTEVRTHDREVAERDEDLEEWIVVRHRKLKQRWHIAPDSAVSDELHAETDRLLNLQGGTTP